MIPRSERISLALTSMMFRCDQPREEARLGGGLCHLFVKCCHSILNLDQKLSLEVKEAELFSKIAHPANHLKARLTIISFDKLLEPTLLFILFTKAILPRDHPYHLCST